MRQNRIPRIVRHYEMQSCSGPCDQGHRKCPCPDACEHGDPPPWLASDIVIAVLAVVVIGLIFAGVI